MPEQLSPSLLLEIAREHGTPVYVYDAGRVQEQFSKLRKSFPEETRIFYACKALTNLNILRLIFRLGGNADCSSLNEVLLALRAGFPPGRILYTSNNVSFEELEAVAAQGVNINIDNLSGLRHFGRCYGADYPVGIRIRPNILAGGNLKISTGHAESKFGIPIEQLDQVQAIAEETGLVIRTLHIHTGSDIGDTAVFLKGVELLTGLLPHFPQVTNLDLGGGFKVRYRPEDPEIEMAKLGEGLRQYLENHARTTGRRVNIWLEPGKFLVSEAGWLLTRVNVVKQTPTVTFAGVDTGLHQFIRPMFYDAWHGVENLSNPTGRAQRYTVTGLICETDTIAADRDLPETREGDILAIRNAGAYGFEMSSHYNSRVRPPEVLVEDGRPRLIRARETLDDLLRNQIFP